MGCLTFSFLDNNPELVAALKRDADRAKIAANRWTDNIFTLKSYLSSNFGMESNQFDQHFEIPDNFDYVS